MISRPTTEVSDLDRFLHAMQARFTLNVSPTAMMLAWLDWAINLSTSPGKQIELTQEAMHCWQHALLGAPFSMAGVSQESPDDRFAGEDWQKWPFSWLSRSFLQYEDWWMKATTGVPGVSSHHENLVSFTARQILDMLAPSNFPWTNPDVLKVTFQKGGWNLVEGAKNFLQDKQRDLTRKGPVGMDEFRVGEKVAVTTGKVIYRNNLIELIQYSPATAQVHAEPVLIIPAWIMKYYILDLSPHNSLVKYLVEKGHTVFMISWKNPDEHDRDLEMDDYQNRGVMSAVEVVSAVVPGKKIHAVGYCLGGTLLSIAAATMARNGDDRLKSMTLFAAQTDFTEAGEIMVFIDENQLAYLEDIMWQQGYLDTKSMAGAFQMLRSTDLIWSEVIHDYLMGQRKPMFDLMAWNADATRMPYRMHSEYLRRLFLNNDLYEGRYEVGGQVISLSDIHVPVFIVSTLKDHVAPWRSVYKFHLMSDAETITFVLTSGGHNAGIVSEPGHPHRTYQIATHTEGERYVGPDEWRQEVPMKEGSWWPAFEEWLAQHSSGREKPPAMGSPKKGYQPICEAPGTYVLVP